jgi:hypothetical protein
MRKGEYGALSIVRRVIQVASHLPVLQALLVTSVKTNHNKFRVHYQLSIILLHLACNKGKTSLYIKIGVCFILFVTTPKPSQTVGHSLRFWYSWKATRQGGVHVHHFTIFRPMEQKLLNVE